MLTAASARFASAFEHAREVGRRFGADDLAPTWPTRTSQLPTIQRTCGVSISTATPSETSAAAQEPAPARRAGERRDSSAAAKIAKL